MGCIMQYTDKPLEEQNFSSKDELGQGIYGFNNTGKAYDKDSTIHKLFEKQVEKSAEKSAAVYIDKHITYKELNEKSNQLAKKLRLSGVKRDDIVALVIN